MNTQSSDNMSPEAHPPAHANEPIICPYCQIEQETVGGFIAHLKLLHQPAHASEEVPCSKQSGWENWEMKHASEE